MSQDTGERVHDASRASKRGSGPQNEVTNKSVTGYEVVHERNVMAHGDSCHGGMLIVLKELSILDTEDGVRIGQFQQR